MTPPTTTAPPQHRKRRGGGTHIRPSPRAAVHRSSTSGGPRYTAPASPTAAEWQMERAAHRRVPLMTFGSGLPSGPARSPVVFLPHYRPSSTTTSTTPVPRRGGEEGPTLDLHTERAAHRSSTRSRYRIQAPTPPQHPEEAGGGTYARPSLRAGRSQASSINDLRARTCLWVGSLLRLSFPTLCRFSTRS
ncbi:hypothetical protein DPEC_G00259770 [Dallia pectoralis]|uniref:Uncharacterized protein n=1 Tax=Dallia pectoralis TaxID=75939 RepID=A0ACC2FRF0_DALPE|nr:hypothetical protein DPEC_G00259770 [Dallia pectoralis]